MAIVIWWGKMQMPVQVVRSNVQINCVSLLSCYRPSFVRQGVDVSNTIKKASNRLTVIKAIIKNLPSRCRYRWIYGELLLLTDTIYMVITVMYCT